MSANPPSRTIAAAEGISPIYRQAKSEIAAEDAAQDTLNFVMANVRANRRTLDVAEAIYGNSKARHARTILFDALVLSHSIKFLDITKILNALRAYDLAGAYDFEAMIEMLEIVEDTAREMARECREYAGDAA